MFNPPSAILVPQFGTLEQQMASFSSANVIDSQLPQKHHAPTFSKRFENSSDSLLDADIHESESDSSGVAAVADLVGWKAYPCGMRSGKKSARISHSSSLSEKAYASAMLLRSNARTALWDIPLRYVTFLSIMATLLGARGAVGFAQIMVSKCVSLSN